MLSPRAICCGVPPPPAPDGLAVAAFLEVSCAAAPFFDVSCAPAFVGVSCTVAVLVVATGALVVAAGLVVAFAVLAAAVSGVVVPAGALIVESCGARLGAIAVVSIGAAPVPTAAESGCPARWPPPHAASTTRIPARLSPAIAHLRGTKPVADRHDASNGYRPATLSRSVMLRTKMRRALCGRSPPVADPGAMLPDLQCWPSLLSGGFRASRSHPLHVDAGALRLRTRRAPRRAWRRHDLPAHPGRRCSRSRAVPD